MKVRMDFVTNSSSSSFIVRIGVRLKNGMVVNYEAFAEDDGGGIDYGEIIVDRQLFKKAAGAKNIDELLCILENAVSYNYAEEDASYTTDHWFDPKDFELYKGIRKKSYTKEDYLETEFGFEETNDDLSDGRSVPYSKGVVIFDKALRKSAKSLDDIQSVIVESELSASGEYIESDKFPGLDWSEDGMYAECISVSEINLQTQEIKEETKSKWG